MLAMAAAALDVDFYVSSTDGPTLRIAGSSDGMTILREACKRLADGGEGVRFSDLEGVALSRNVGSVEFRLGDPKGLCQRTGDPPAFVFDGDRAQWEERVLLLDPLVSGAPDTFQLLEPNDVEGICVEAAVTR